MYPPTPMPMEAAIMAQGAGLLVQSRPGSSIISSRARGRAWGHGTGVGYSATPSAARRRLLVASLGVRNESPPAQSPGEEEQAMAVEVEDADDSGARILPSPDGDRAPLTFTPPDAKTVRVKFVLEKECAFGQQFVVVGDDPALGLWDPAKAVALDWSEGHVWTVKTDLPAKKLIEFKFLLRDASGHVRWQHGANRTLQTTETPNTLVVHEDWDRGNNQRVSEEEELSVAEEGLFITGGDVTLSDDLAGSDGAMMEDELRTGDNPESNKSAVVVADASPHDEMKKGANAENRPQFILEEDRKILNELHGKGDTAPQNGYLSAAAAADDDNAKANEDDAAMYQAEAQVVNRSTSSIFENDLAWARKALRELLRFLGFQIGTTTT